MAEIVHRLVVRAPAERIYRALTEQDGLASWWTRRVRATAKVGAVAEISSAAAPPTKLRITALLPNERVEGRCLEGPREWIGTDVVFSLAARGETTVVRFAHRGWIEADEYFAECKDRWANELTRLKSFAEAGARAS